MSVLLRVAIVCSGLVSLTGCDACDKRSSPPVTAAPAPEGRLASSGVLVSGVRS
ncbi:MAG: hypothetical protein MUF64_32095 [Polyangiaceae bacterium]|nr:hypothetical protein [Polyangiaceae bacterium]